MAREIYRDLTHGQMTKMLNDFSQRKDVEASWCSAGWDKGNGLIRYTVTVIMKEKDEKADHSG